MKTLCHFLGLLLWHNNKHIRIKHKTSMLLQYAVILCALFFVSGSKNYAPQNTNSKIVRRFNKDNISVVITQSPNTFLLTNDLFITIYVHVNNGTKIQLNNLLFPGFKLISEFDSVPSVQNGKVIYSRHVRLQPLIANNYSLAPFTITCNDRTHYPAIKEIFNMPEIKLTPYISDNFPQHNLINTFIPVTHTISWPLTITIIFFIMGTLILLLTYLARKMKTSIATPISPHDSAINKLDYLLSENLPAHNSFSEFYFVLSDIIRCYIEETVSVHSTHKTSNELISALKNINYINIDTIQNLQILLQHCDLIKFASKIPTPNEISEDITRAKQLLKNDIILKTEDKNEL